MNPTGFVDGNRDDAQTLVTVFLRGGADVLHMVPPVEDDGFYAMRAQTGIAKRAALPLDGLFGMHPLLKGLQSLYTSGDLLVVHGAGSEDTTRSHFEAQDFMEHGGPVSGGWLGRYLRASQRGGGNPLTAVALGKTQPECLRGAPGILVIENLDALKLGERAGQFLDTLLPLYETEDNTLGQAGRDAAVGLRRLDALRREGHRPANDAVYPGGAFGDGLQQIAQLIKGNVGLRAVALDLNGWDSHFAMTTVLDPLLRELGDGLEAFARDLGPEQLRRTTVLVMSEFGRRVYENASFGTDHGRGGLMLALGGGVAGGRILHQWKGVAEDVLEPPGDLPVTFNYRDILAPVLARLAPAVRMGDVFPGYPVQAAPVYG